LTVQQKVYAATDAWATLQIYLKLLKEKKLSKKEIENLAAEFAVENHVK
jgi:hypothetical protein